MNQSVGLSTVLFFDTVKELFYGIPQLVPTNQRRKHSYLSTTQKITQSLRDRYTHPLGNDYLILIL